MYGYKHIFKFKFVSTYSIEVLDCEYHEELEEIIRIYACSEAKAREVLKIQRSTTAEMFELVN